MKVMIEKELEVLASETEKVIEVSDIGRKNKKLTKEEFRNLWLKEREPINGYQNLERILH